MPPGSLDPDIFLDRLDAEMATVCGREPISLLLETLRAFEGGEDLFQQTLDYQTSGAITGDYSHSVSYAALGYFPWSSFKLPEYDSGLLLESAYATLRRYQQTGEAVPVPVAVTTSALERRAAAFVTLRQRGRLCGCVGRCTADESLARVIPEMTLAAALDDVRFPPLALTDEDIDIEISVLSPMKPIANPSAFQIGRDGAYLRAEMRTGILLPHVADGRNWTGKEFLAALAQKAGVDADIYSKKGTSLAIFRAQVIH